MKNRYLKKLTNTVPRHMFPDYQTHRDRYTEANMACTGTERQTAMKTNWTHRGTDGWAGRRTDR